MKFIYIFFFLLFLSCESIKKVYVCGDHPCVNKKEFNEYFSKNLIIEIKPQTNKKNKKIDLVRLNSDSLSEKKNNLISLKRNAKKKNQQKKKLKEQKIRILEEQKINRIKQKNKAKEEAKITKLSKSKVNSKKKIDDEKNSKAKEIMNIIKKKPSQEKNQKIASKENISNSRIETEDTESICNLVKNCDIDKIAELLSEKGKNKPYPDITSN